MIEKVDFRNLVKFYEKPNISKFKKTLVKGCVPSQLDTSLYNILDTFWFISSSFLEKPPNWQGFMADITHGTPLPSQIRFHPIIPLDPSSYEAVYSTLDSIREEIKKKSIRCTSLTFDQPLYWKAQEIKADKSPEFDSIHLKLGGFHQLMSFLGAGCKLMEDGGSEETLVDCVPVPPTGNEMQLPKTKSGRIAVHRMFMLQIWIAVYSPL